MAGCAGAHDTVGVGAGQDAVTVEEGVTEGGVPRNRTTRGRTGQLLRRGFRWRQGVRHCCCGGAAVRTLTISDPTLLTGKVPPPPAISWYAAFWADDLAAAVADGGKVSVWADRSGNGRSLTQADSAKQPIFRHASSLLNHRSAVEFDGSDDFMRTATWTDVAQVISYVIVFQPRTLVTYNAVLDKATNTDGMYLGIESDKLVLWAGSLDWSQGTASAGVSYAARALFNGTSSRANVNGSGLSSGTNVGLGKSNGLSVAANRVGGTNSAITVAFVAMYAGDVTGHANWGAFCAWVAAVYGLTLG